MIACDKNELPLENARSNFQGLEKEIRESLELRLGDGLNVLGHGEVDTVTTSGIGGSILHIRCGISCANLAPLRPGKFIAEILFGENFLQAEEGEEEAKVASDAFVVRCRELTQALLRPGNQHRKNRRKSASELEGARGQKIDPSAH